MVFHAEQLLREFGCKTVAIYWRFFKISVISFKCFTTSPMKKKIADGNKDIIHDNTMANMKASPPKVAFAIVPKIIDKDSASAMKNKKPRAGYNVVFVDVVGPLLTGAFPGSVLATDTTGVGCFSFCLAANSGFCLRYSS